LSNPALGRRYSDVPASPEAPVTTAEQTTADFASLFAAQYTALTRLIYRVVGDTASAEELASEAFWRLHRNRPASDHNLVGWLRRTGVRLALDSLRKRKRREHYEAQSPPPTACAGPEEALEQRERQVRVRAVLAAIKREQAALLVLRSEGYSLAEIGAALGYNPNSVGTMLARADAAFRKEYVKRYGER
jgi:RNA polymerase sigma-70 factor (ECF subfamily)